MVSTGEVNILRLIHVLFSIISVLLNSGRTSASYPEIVSDPAFECGLTSSMIERAQKNVPFPLTEISDSRLIE